MRSLCSLKYCASDSELVGAGSLEELSRIMTINGSGLMGMQVMRRGKEVYALERDMMAILYSAKDEGMTLAKDASHSPR